MSRKFPLLLAAACFAMLLGTALRLKNVNHTMSHPEMFVPGIPVPADLAIPPPRMTLWETVSDTLTHDTHPPFYYVLMWFVTKVFGSGTLAIRFPSVVFGVASIGLLFWLGMLVEQPVAGAFAALFLAMNGYQIIWSQAGRMYALIGFLSLAATIQLLKLARAGRSSLPRKAAYAAILLLGLSSHVFFWAVLAAQMAWVLANAWTQQRPMPRLLKIQFVAMILGSPLLGLAAYQSGNQVAFLSRDVPLVARQFIEFAYLIPGWDDTSAPGGAPAAALDPRFTIPLLAFFLLCLLLLAVGISRLKPMAERTLLEPGGSFTRAWLISAALAFGSLVFYIAFELRHKEQKPTLRLMEVSTVLPWLMAAAAILLQKYWNRLAIPPARVRFMAGGPPLVVAMFLIPFSLLALVSLIFRPLMDPRGLVYIAPYLLLALACGTVALAIRSRLLGAALFLILGGLHVVSVAAYNGRTISPVDFKEFTAGLEPLLRRNDLIFYRKDWDTDPILYYLKTDKHHLLAGNYPDRQSYPASRIWVLRFRGEDFPPLMKPILEGYRPVTHFDRYLASATLYCRDSCE